MSECIEAKKSKAHPGFAAVAKKIAKTAHVSPEAAAAIAATAARKASKSAKKKNPNLKKVKMPKKK